MQRVMAGNDSEGLRYASIEWLALEVNAAIMGSQQNGGKTNAMKTRRVRIDIRAVLAQAAA